MQVQEIRAEDTIDLRSRILRPGQEVELCHYPEDNLPTTFHLGIFGNERVICNGTFIQQGHSYFSEAKYPYRLRGMASDKKFQGQGLGSKLLCHALQQLKAKNCDLLWFNARTSAENFYRKLGFESTGEIFDITSIGPHKVMYKWI